MAAGTPFTPREQGRDSADRGWLARHGWKLGLVALVLGGNYLFGRRRRRDGRSISVDRVSESWLAQHEFDAGRSDHTT